MAELEKESRQARRSASEFWNWVLPFEVVSLLDFLTDLDIESLMRAHSILSLLALDIGKHSDVALLHGRPNDRIRADTKAAALQGMSLFRRAIRELGLKIIEEKCLSLERDLAGNMQASLLLDRIKEIESILSYELATQRFLRISRDNQKYLADDRIPESVRDNFSECLFDLGQANRCFALGLNRACIFHCMCILQPIIERVATIAQGLGSGYDPGATALDQLGAITKRLDSEIKTLEDTTKSQQRNDLLRQLGSLNSQARNALWAWRHDTVHGRGQSDADIAGKVLDIMMNFVQEVAKIPKPAQP